MISIIMLSMTGYISIKLIKLMVLVWHILLKGQGTWESMV